MTNETPSRMIVKPLEWDARGWSGDYKVQPTYGMGPKPFMVSRGSHLIGHVNSEKEGRGVAQADHEVRVRSFVAFEPVEGARKVPAGQTPLDANLNHRYLDVFRGGEHARDSGASSPYDGWSLEHCLHAAGWVQRDLRIALDRANGKVEPGTPDEEAWEVYRTRPTTDADIEGSALKNAWYAGLHRGRTVPAENPVHASDCALHNGPATTPKPCDCGADPGMTPERYGSEFPAQEPAPAGWEEKVRVLADAVCEGWCKENGGEGHFKDCLGCTILETLGFAQLTDKEPAKLLPTVWIMRTESGHFYPIQPSDRCKPEDHGLRNPHVVAIEDANGNVLWRRTKEG